MKSRRLLSAVAVVAAAALGLSACGAPSPTNSSGPAPADTPSTPASAPAVDKTFKIASAVIISHPALQAAQDGFEEVLKEQGVKYTLDSKNAQGESSNAATIASGFAADQDIDLILAISTPIALAVANAEKQRPILFTAVTDPVRDGLVPSWEQAGTNITGTSDLNPEAKPVTLVTEAMPQAKTIGVLYSQSESNSVAQVEAYQAEAATLSGITIKPQGITSASEVSTGLEALKGVDAILIPTDNTVVASISNVIGFGRENKIPVFCADTSTVSLGTVATRGLSYHDLGRRTGEMAVSILRDGTAINTITPEATTSTELLVNTEAAASFGLTLPADLVGQAAQDVKTAS